MIKFQSFLSSSAGNATFVTDDSVHILVDCGANGKYMTECLRRIGVNPASLSGIFITHEHRDHVTGAGILSRRFNLPIYASRKTWDAMEVIVGSITPENKRIVDGKIKLSSLTVTPFSIPHDAADPLAYSFTSGQEKFTIATDIGHITPELTQNLTGSTSVIIESNHDVKMLSDGPYPYPLKQRILGERGHLSNDTCASFCRELADAGTKSFWLGHLSLENNEPHLAYQATVQALHDCKEKDLSVNVLPRFWLTS